MAGQLEVKGKYRKGKAGEWNKFTITPKTDFEGALGGIVVSFDGASKPQLVFEYETNKVIVKYLPELPGDYRLEITKGGFDIPGSPFKCKILPASSPIAEKIKVYGQGLTDPKSSFGNMVYVDVNEAHIVGVALKAYMSGKTFPMRKYGKPDVYVSEDQPGIHTVKYVPKFAGPYKLFLEFGNIACPGSPFSVEVADPNEPGAQPVWPEKHKPKRVLFSTPRAQQVSITVTPC